MVDPAGTARAYITDDEVDPSRLGLATSGGRFQIEVAPASCGWQLSPGENVVIQGFVSDDPPAGSAIAADGLGTYSLGQPEGDTSCLVYVHQRMSAIACFTDEQGGCDAAQEKDQ